MLGSRLVKVYLGIDTSTPFLSLALCSANDVLATFQENLGRDHAKRLVSELEHLFQKANIQKSDLAGIGVGIGPGSYTGLRVGVAAAKGLSRALGTSLSGVDSLAASAYACLRGGETGYITLDARRGNVYAGLYQKSKNEILTLKTPEKLEFSSLEQTYPFFKDQPPSAVYIAQQAKFAHHSPKALYL